MENEEQFIQSLTYADISRALARDFFRVFCVNTETEVFVEYDADPEDESMDINMQGSDFRRVVRRLKESAYSEDLDMVRTAFTKENILRVLNEDMSFSLNYRMMINRKASYVHLKAVRIRQEDPRFVLIALSNSDAHMQRLAIYERTMNRSLTYAGVAEALAADYVCIYYVNTNSGEFAEYKSSEDFKKLRLAKSGPDFFAVCRGEFAALVFEEDRETFCRALEKENVMRVLSVDRMFLLTFRVILRGVPTYIRMKITPMLAEDDHHIVVGLSNVDASMQRSAEYRRMKEIANRDPLTGVKSKHAFTVAEEQLDRHIREGAPEVFAVAVCDVNGLKQVNDTLGHKAGDLHIKKASELLCGIFKHSPVYRVGGDEFAILLTGRDYAARAELLGELNRLVEENLETGGVVISVGLSDFEAGQDGACAQVFERADALMYRRKAQLKGRAG